MKTCEDCGSAVYKLGCVNCDEEEFIAQQEEQTRCLECGKAVEPYTLACDECVKAVIAPNKEAA